MRTNLTWIFYTARQHDTRRGLAVPYVPRHRRDRPNLLAYLLRSGEDEGSAPMSEQMPEYEDVPEGYVPPTPDPDDEAPTVADADVDDLGEEDEADRG